MVVVLAGPQARIGDVAFKMFTSPQACVEEVIWFHEHAKDVPNYETAVCVPISAFRAKPSPRKEDA